MRSTLAAAALVTFVALGAFAAPPASAQPANGPPAGAYRGPDVAAQRAAIDRLAPLIGRWQGEANLTSPAPMVVHQTERAERDLDGLLLVVHGAGYATADHSGAPVFQAVAVVSYDDRRSVYEFRSYAMGYATTAEGAFQADGSFVWSINAGGPVRIRYTIRFDANTWREIGEMSYDSGATWRQTISMNLTRAP